MRHLPWLLLLPVATIFLLIGLSVRPKAEPAFPPAMHHFTLPQPFTPVNNNVRIVTDVPYSNDMHPRHKLDLYLPPGNSQYPVVVYLHGGTWSSGDRSLYGHLGRWFASNGIIAVIPSYRLSPEVNCDGQMQDVTKALHWTHARIAGFGGRPERIFLMGHSSGAHLASLMETNDSWVRKEYSTNPMPIPRTRVPCGVICVSGIYSIGWNVKLAGAGDVFKGLDKRQYSPVNYVKGDEPPFLLLYAEKDYKTLAGQSTAFHKRLLAAGCRADLYMVAKEDHMSEIINMVMPTSPHGSLVLNWIKAN